MTKLLRVLVVEDSEDDAILLVRNLERAGFGVSYKRVYEKQDLISALDDDWDIVLCDYKMPRLSAPNALELLRNKGRDMPFIVVSGTVGEDIAAEMMAEGADDYVMKDKLTRLAPAIEREIREYTVRREKMEAQESLRRSEERFRGMAERILDVIYEIDSQGRFTYVSPSIKRVAGYEPQEMVGRYFSDFLDDESILVAQKNLKEKLVSGADTDSLELVGIKKDGSKVMIDLNLAIIVKDGKVIGGQGMFMDITSRKRAEERLSKINEAFLSFTSDPDHNIRQLTSACGQILGATCAIYNRLEDGMLCSCGIWNTPPDYKAKDEAAGHICFDVINEKSDDIFIIRNLERTKYAMTDPNVALYGLKSYVGKSTKLSGNYIGSLCAVFQKDIEPDELDLRFLDIAASAISIEEERRFARAQIEEQLLFLQQLIDSIPNPVYYKDLDGVYLGCNIAFEKFVGRPRDTIIGKTVRDVLLDEDSQYYASKDRELLANPGVQIFMRKHSAPDGSEYTYIFNKAVYRNRSGTVSGIVCLIEDVTSLKRTEEDARRAKDFLDGIINALADPVFVKDGQHRMIIVNDAECRLTGHPREKVIGHTDHDFFPKEQVDVFWEKDEKVLSSGITDENEELITDSDGNTKTILTKKSLYEDPVTGNKMLVGVIRDITDRKLMEKITERSYEVQKAINDLLNFSLSDITIEDILDKALKLMLGIKGFAFQGQGCIFAVEGGDKLVMKAKQGVSEDLIKRCSEVKFGECLCGKAASTGVVQIAPSVDHRHTLSIKGALSHSHCCIPIVFNGKTVGVINLYLREGSAEVDEEKKFLDAMAAVLAGVIGRKKTEIQLKETQSQIVQMEKMQVLGTMATGIAHEVKNPLGIIMLASNYLEKKADLKKPEELDAVTAIRDAVVRADKIIRSLLSFSRHSQLELKHCDARVLIETALGIITKQADIGNIVIKKEFNIENPIVNVDAVQVEQAIINIIVNAIQAMPKGGDLTVKVYNVTADYVKQKMRLMDKFLSDTGNVVICEIADNGPGISSENLNKVFDPFFTTKKPGQGVGLGLSITRTIVEANKGAIRVESEYGKGARFMIALPAVR